MKPILLMLGIMIPAMASANNWEIDPTHTNVNFEVDHLAFSTVKGRFDKFQGSIVTDEKTNLTTLSGTVDAKSINTDNDKRDKHLRSADFFDVAKFPKIDLEFPSLKIKAGKTDKVRGKLTIRGTTKEVPVEIAFRGAGTDPWGNEKLGLRLRTEINRKDFGLSWNEVLETGGVLVGEKVKIEVNVEAKKMAMPTSTKDTSVSTKKGKNK